MSPLTLLFLIFALGTVGWLTARARAVRFRLATPGRFSSLPGHHAAFAALCTVAPALLFVLAWRFVSPALVTDAVLATPAASALPSPGFERAAILSEARTWRTDTLMARSTPSPPRWRLSTPPRRNAMT